MSHPRTPLSHQGRRAIGARQRRLMAGRIATPDADGVIVLQSAVSLRLQFWILLLFGLLWNSVIVVVLTQSPRELVPMVMVVPFVLAGLGLMAMIFRAALALGNPQATIRLSDGRMRPGDSMKLAWSLSGNHSKIARLSIGFEVRQISIGSDGKSRVNATLLRQSVVETVSPVEIRGGEARLTIPDNTPTHSNNEASRVAWFIVVHGEILQGPDVHEEYVLNLDLTQGDMEPTS